MFKKLRVLISAQHALMLAYRAEIYLWVLAHVLPFIMMSIWMTAAGANGGGRFSMSAVGYAQYFAAVFIVRQFTAVWMIYEFEWHVNEGRLSPMLLRPMNVLWHYVSAHLGEQLARFPFFLLMLTLFFVCYPAAFWWPGAGGLVFGVIAIYSAFALRFALNFCLCTMNFWMERASSLDQLMMLPYLFLSGLIIPMRDMPAGLRTFSYYTPFPYLIDFPARILMGQIGVLSGEFWQGFGVMAIWFGVFFCVGGVLWRRGLLQYSGHGA